MGWAKRAKEANRRASPHSLASGAVSRNASKRGPFADAANAFATVGMVPIPVGGHDGKKPLIRYRSISGSYEADRLAELIGRFGGANIALLCGPSRLTVIDCDDRLVVPEMLSRFGETPVRIRTGSGNGIHLYYRSSGEACSTALDGLPVDVKGVGGVITAPPSIRPGGARYDWDAGSVADLSRLPTIKPNALPVLYRKASTTTAVEGERNRSLFSLCLREAKHTATYSELLQASRGLNEMACHPPLSADEVAGIARSAWRYQQEGKNWVGGEARAMATDTLIKDLGSQPAALALLMKLQLAHGVRNQPFAVCPKAMAREGTIPGWKHGRYREARETLKARGYLHEVTPATRNRPAQLVLTERVPGVRKADPI